MSQVQSGRLITIMTFSILVIIWTVGASDGDMFCNLVCKGEARCGSRTSRCLESSTAAPVCENLYRIIRRRWADVRYSKKKRASDKKRKVFPIICGDPTFPVGTFAGETTDSGTKITITFDRFSYAVQEVIIAGNGTKAHREWGIGYEFDGEHLTSLTGMTNGTYLEGSEFDFSSEKPQEIHAHIPSLGASIALFRA
ncbi:hypothetical protein FOL47_008600 [Perkinsus chesapeaki]|uniref:Uncharacterized protein n=1 Tax=Perkinsus chesapeaki TaxID=330153 RepID=A0A7J6MTD4_PERCH|nr:hypothetical protein FOL47_008600 [Perkinsus chesapeaki]